MSERDLATARLLVAQEAAQLGLWDWDLTTNALVWDARSIAMYGLAGVELDGTVDDISRTIHPDDLPSVTAALAQAIEARGVVDVEFRVVWPDGWHRRIYARGQVLVDDAGGPVRVIGTNADVTQARREAAQQAADAQQMAGLVAVAHALGEAIQEGDVLAVITGAGVQLLQAQGAVLTLRDGDGVRCLNTSTVGHGILGRQQVLPAGFPLPLVDAATTGTAHFFDDRSQAAVAFPDGEHLLAEGAIEGVAAVPLRSGRTSFGSLAVAFTRPHPWRGPERDLLTAFAALTAQALLRITARAAEREALRQAQESAARLALVAQVTAQLAAAEDVEQAVADLARLVVPSLADWCIVTLVDEDAPSSHAVPRPEPQPRPDPSPQPSPQSSPAPAGEFPWSLPEAAGRLRDVGTWHARPPMRPLVDAYARQRLAAMRPGAHLVQALTSRQPVAVPAPEARLVDAHLSPGPATELLAELAPEHGVIVPLRADQQVVGIMTAFTDAGRDIGDHDLTTLVEVADRAALALRGMRLRAAQRDLSEALQRSLLTELPEPDHLELAARYVPAAKAAHVGGDWYDAFLVGAGSTCLVVGDVTGHDRRAAAVMAQVRNVLRGTAHAVGARPAAVLTALDRAMKDLAVEGPATAVLAVVEQDAAQVVTGRRTLRWSSAGHLPPVVLAPGGRAELLSRPSDLMLGVDERARRADHTCVLEPGATVVLYTDGLVERRGEDLDVGLDRLRRACSELAHLPLEALCDALVADLAGAEDDVALLALRAHPQDAPRPPEAGPEVLPADLLERTSC